MRVRLIRSPLSIVGMVLTTISAVVFLVVFLADLFGMHTNPYIGIVFFLILPGVFVLGCSLIPLGAWLERRRRAAGKGPSERQWPSIDLNDPRQRRIAVAVFALTMANIVIVSLAAYRGVEYMDSVQFCGQACHSVMKPEATAHQDGPHARVTCVQCHIGPGATWFAKSKISGARQILAVTFKTYSRPIPSPVQNLRPARDTCEQCHWPAKFHGDKVVRSSSTPTTRRTARAVTTLQLHVGGQRAQWRVGHSLAHAVRQRDRICRHGREAAGDSLRAGQGSHGRRARDVAEGVTPDQVAKGERRRMDCMDCHNRPSHQMAASADRAVDAAIAGGHPGIVAVRQARSRESARGELSDRTRRWNRSRAATRLLSHLARADVQGAAAGRGESRERDPAGLSAQRVPRYERPVRHLSEQRRSHGFSGVFPLS